MCRQPAPFIGALYLSLAIFSLSEKSIYLFPSPLFPLCGVGLGVPELAVARKTFPT